MAKKRPSGDGGGSWMDTYGDLVTLLLTFFVMLYSMSNLDAKKWEIFVRSIGSQNSELSQEEITVNAPLGTEAVETLGGNEDFPSMEVEMDAETLYLTLLDKLNETGVNGISVSRGEDYTFITFQDTPFFDGNSSVLTDQGKEVLDVFCQVIDGASHLISQISIMGHTAQELPDTPNDARADRMLAAMRASEVCIYVQGMEVIEPEKLVCISYGQHRPVAPFDTSENRALNRRVEILLQDAGADVDDMNDNYYQYRDDVYTESAGDTLNVPDGTLDLTDDEQGFEFAEPRPEDVAAGQAPLTPPGEIENTPQ